MKTKHIIAIGLLTALAVGVLGLAIYTKKKPTKTLQTEATNYVEYQKLNDGYQLRRRYYFHEITRLNPFWQIAEGNISLQYTESTNTYRFALVLTTISLNKTNNIYNNEIKPFPSPLSIQIGTWTNTNNESVDAFTISQIGKLTKTDSHKYSLQNIRITLQKQENNTTTILNNFTLNDYEITTQTSFNDQTGDQYNSTADIGPSTIYINTIVSTATQQYTNGETAGYTTGYTQGTTTGYNNGYTAGETAGYQTGTTDGYNTGYSEGSIAGYNNGYTAGETAGYNTGYTEGLTANTTESYNQGYNVGYGIGYNDSEAFNHPIDLIPTMLSVLTMPFTFISQAFDVTLWPGTQYQINIGNFIKAMLAISAILFIIKLFTSGFSIIGNYTNSRIDGKLKKSQIEYNKAKTNLANRTDPNHKSSSKTSTNINHNYNHKE